MHSIIARKQIYTILIHGYTLLAGPLGQLLMKGSGQAELELSAVILQLGGFGNRDAIFHTCGKPALLSVLQHFQALLYGFPAGNTAGQLRAAERIAAFFLILEYFNFVWKFHVVF